MKEIPMTSYQFARAVDIDGVNTARVDVPITAEFRIVLSHYLRAHPDLPFDLEFEGRDSLAVAGSVSKALNYQYLHWETLYLPAKRWEYFYPWPYAPFGPSPQDLSALWWNFIYWISYPQTVTVLLITLGTAGVSILFAWLLSYVLYRLGK